MRRILLTATGVAALVLAAPGVALAHHRHHHKHHARHAQVSFRHLGPVAAGPAVPPSGSPAPTTRPAAPTPTTTPTTEENAGKVTSYTGGMLTVTLGNGSTVSGKVTVDTRFRCISATATQPPADTDDEPGSGDDNGWGDDRGEEDRNQQGGPPWREGQPGPQAGGPWQQGDDNGPGDDQDDDEAPISSEPPCDSSALVEGAIVRAAELRIAPGGAEFEWIELVR